MLNEPIITIEDEQTELRWALRKEVIDCLQMWLLSEQRNESCGEAVDFVEAMEKFIDFKIEQALNKLRSTQ